LDGGSATIVSRIDQLPHIDGAVVATTNDTHADAIEELLPRGVPIFVEKPLVMDPAVARSLARRAPERLFVMDKWRYHPGVEELARIARSGELGPVQGLRCARLSKGNPHTGADPIWILAPHDLAIGLEVLGFIPDPRDAVAEAVGGAPSGLLARLGDHPWFSLEVSCTYSVHRREVRLHCGDGVAALLDGYADEVQILRHITSPSGTTVEVEARPISNEMPLLRELQAFVGHLGGGPAPRSSAAEGARIVETIAMLRERAGLGGR
jgi:predicted dehydrogenase